MYKCNCLNDKKPKFFSFAKLLKLSDFQPEKKKFFFYCFSLNRLKPQ